MSERPDMLKYLNTHDKDDVYSRVLSYLLTHQSRIPQKSIITLARDAYVSPSTISRTVQKFGFLDLKQFKIYIDELNHQNSDYGFRLNHTAVNLLKSDPKIFLKYYKEKIAQSLDDVYSSLNMNEIDNLLSEIQSHKNIILFSASESNFLTKELQRGLYASNKLVRIWDLTRNDSEILKYLDKDSVAIIISNFGNFLINQTNLINQILATNCETFLLTQHTYNMTSLTFDHTINITANNHVEAGSYPMFFVCEFLSRRYYLKYFK